jgi:hypothetical protein
MIGDHETVLRDLTARLSALDPVCSVMAEGSIGRGESRPDSDMDIVVISWRFQVLADELEWQFEKNLFNCDRGIEVKLDSGLFHGFQLDLHCRSPRNHVNLIMGGPVYRWGGTRVLYDPSGIARWGMECTERLLADNPDFAARLRRFHDQHQEWKRHKTTVREFETQLEFGESVDSSALVRNYKTFAEWTSATILGGSD